MKTCAILLCAGRGERFGADVPKALAPLGGRPLFTWSLAALTQCSAIDGIVLVGPVRTLRDLKDRPRLLAHCTEINRLENVGDQLLRRAVARLFRESRDPIHVIKWKEIYDYLENAIDRCEDVANVIEGIVLENS